MAACGGKDKRQGNVVFLNKAFTAILLLKLDRCN